MKRQLKKCGLNVTGETVDLLDYLTVVKMLDEIIVLFDLEDEDYNIVQDSLGVIKDAHLKHNNPVTLSLAMRLGISDYGKK